MREHEAGDECVRFNPEVPLDIYLMSALFKPRSYSNDVAYQNELPPERTDSQVQQKSDRLLTMISSQKNTRACTVTSVESLKETGKNYYQNEKENVANKTSGMLEVLLELSVRYCLV